MHVCVDDATRLAYVEVLADEKATTAVGFLARAIALLRRHGITVERVMTDNGSAYRSTIHAFACRALGIRHLRTRPYRPRTNGKAERFIRTLLGGWAYGAIYAHQRERTAALDGWLWTYNHRRPHGSLSHKPPDRSPQRAAARFARQPERPLGDHVAHDLRAAARDRVGARVQELVLPDAVGVRVLAGRDERARPLQSHAELGHGQVELAERQLAHRHIGRARAAGQLAVEPLDHELVAVLDQDGEAAELAAGCRRPRSPDGRR